jgi:hypothetical protein
VIGQDSSPASSIKQGIKVSKMMGGTQYDNNSFKMVSKNAGGLNHKKANQSGIRDQSVSPPLKPIEEVSSKKEGKAINLSAT